MKDAWAWKKYQMLNHVKCGINDGWNRTMEGIGKPNLKYEPGIKRPEKIAGRPVMSVGETYELIADKIMSETPFLVERFGRVELNMIIQVLNMRYGSRIDERQKALEALCILAGFFPAQIQMGEKFVDLMLKEIPNIDLHAICHLYMEEYMLDRYEKDAKLTYLKYIEPFHISRKSKIKPWSHALSGKKVLIIHPFAEIIENQYHNHRKEIFSRVYDADDILPEFDLKTLKAVQTIAGNRDNRFATWFDALNWMKEECAKIDFDVAILGCGAYGYSLAAEIKRMGKVAIYMGGGTQLLFGIKGARWEDPDYKWYKNIINESWVRPGENEKVKNMHRVENGCYW